MCEIQVVCYMRCLSEKRIHFYLGENETVWDQVGEEFGNTYIFNVGDVVGI